MIYECRMGVPVKSMCAMVDGLHLCAGAFDGSVTMWDIKVHNFKIGTNFYFFNFNFNFGRPFSVSTFQYLKTPKSKVCLVSWILTMHFGVALNYLLKHFMYVSLSPSSFLGSN
jgi:hypothetical protein